jgi:hypothetical protein
MRESKKQWPRTVAEELHESWKTLKRKKDPDVIAKQLGVSRPVIDRALIYGYVSIPDLADKITKYFEDRLNKERGDASRLNNLSSDPERKPEAAMA